MHIDDFWLLVEQARADAGAIDGRFDGDALAEALTARLAALSKDEILDFSECYDEVRDRLESWEMCAACYLISGYISDDTFMDFQAGVVALGRAAFERAVDNPDSLAQHPVVVDIANGRLDRHALRAEGFGYARSDAYTRLSGADAEAYWTALQERDAESGPRETGASAWDGRFGAPGDGELIPIRVPRLAALFPRTTPSSGT